MIKRPVDPRFVVTEENKAFLDPANVIADAQYDAPSYYCHLHNGDTNTYPIDPALYEDPNFVFTPSTDIPWYDNGEGYVEVPEHMQGVVGGEDEDYTGDGVGHVEESENEIPEWLQ